MSPADMFDRTRAHRERFNERGKDEKEAAREAEKNLPPDIKAKLDDLKSDKKAMLDLIEKDQARRRPDDLKAEMKTASLEHPRPGLVPHWVSSWRNRDAIEQRAEKSLAAKYVDEKARGVAAIDRQIDRLTRQGRTPERAKADAPALVTPEFTRSAGQDAPDREAATERTESEDERVRGQSPDSALPEFQQAAGENATRDWTGAERGSVVSALAREIQAAWQAEADRDSDYDLGREK